jgi:sugar lactone lactonase YvrE
MKRYTMMAWVFAVSWLPAMAALASPPVTVLETFNASQGQLPESITADDAGNLYFSVGGTLRKFTTDHQLITLATIPVPVTQGAATLGVKIGPNGFIYVVTAAFAPNLQAAFVWRVSPAGQVSQFANLNVPGAIPNDLVFDVFGNMYVTDSGLGQIWKIDPQGNPTVWFKDPLLLGDATNPVAGAPLGANGIAFDRFRRHLYVANTDFGRIVRIGFQHGQARGIETVTTNGLLRGADGIAFDALGILYVAVNASDRIATVGWDGTVSVVVEGAPLDAPSSLVFGTHGRDRHTLFITNFAILRANGLKTDHPPQPSMASIPVLIPGLDLDLP